MKITAFRSHCICSGHRVVGQTNSQGGPGRCQHLHGHNFDITFFCISDNLNSTGMVIDFGDIKSKLCMFLENSWDHRMLIWDQDPWAKSLVEVDSSVVLVPFNPTAENLASYLLNIVGPEQLKGTGVILDKVQIDETPKCSVTVELEPEIERDEKLFDKEKPIKWYTA